MSSPKVPPPDPAAPPPTIAVDVPTRRREAWSEAATEDRATGGPAGTGERLADGTLPAAGLHFGPWVVLRELGRGGMGAVYLAERADQQFRRRVAIKLIRPGRHGDAVRRRFHAERQILASLEHPHVAHLLDGGETTDGHPWLAMEYVEGDAISAFCDRRRLDVASRVELFLKVASAVEFAHRRLVVHRDIKPGNVLVGEDGSPKLLDFGIAKLLDPEAVGLGGGEATQADERLMTPTWASPEQVLGTPVSTATDVYALGLLLYELLTGRLPYRFRDFSLGEIVRVVAEDEPERPSEVVRHDEELKTPSGEIVRYVPDQAAALRGTNAERLSRQLRGDLDAILLRALRKEPERRYGSVAQLAEDLVRWREGRPVLAHRDSLAYRAGKLARRHRLALAAAGLVAVTLAGGVIATVHQARIARQERARAERRFEEVRALARAVVFDLHDAIADLPGSTAARQLLVSHALRYLDGLAAEAADDPGLQRELAEAYLRIGDVQGRPSTANLGDTAGALASYTKAVGIREVLAARTGAAADRRALAESVGRLGDVQAATGDAAAALASQERAVSLLEEALGAEPGDAEGRRQLATLQTRLGDALSRAGRIDDTLRARRRAIELLDGLATEATGDDELLRLRAQAHQKLANNLGNPSFPNAGDTAGALQHLTRAFELLQPLQDRAERPSAVVTRQLAVNRSNLADVLLARNEPEAALERAREALGLFRAIAEADPRDAQAKHDVSISHQKIGEQLEQAERWREAAAEYDAALRISEALAAGNADNAGPRQDIALMHVRRGFVRVVGGDPRGLDEMARGHALAEELAALDPGNAERRYVVAWAAWNTGDGWSRLAASSGPRSRGARRAATTWYRQAVAILDALEGEGLLSGSDVEEARRVRGLLARAESRSED